MKFKLYKNASIRTRIVINVFVIFCILVASVVTYQTYAIQKLITEQSAQTIERQNHSLISFVRMYMQNYDYKMKSVSYIAIEEWSSGHLSFDKTVESMDEISHIVIMPKINTYLMITKINPQIMRKYFGLTVPEDASYVTSAISLDQEVRDKAHDVQWYTSHNKLIKTDKVSQEKLIPYFDLVNKSGKLTPVENMKEFKLSEISGMPVLLNISHITHVPENMKTAREILKSNSFEAAVVAEMSLASLSVILDSGRPTENSRVLLVDTQEQILADSNIPKDNVIASIQSDNTASLNIAYENCLKQSNAVLFSKIVFNHENHKYRLIVNKFPSSMHLGWRMVSLSPMDDYINETNDIKFYSAMLSLSILVVILLWLYFNTNVYAQTLNNIKAESKKIINFDLADSVLIKSDVKEMNEITAEIQNMKISFRNFSRYIPQSLVQKFADSGQEVEIGGKEMPITLFFSDIQNFTTISEKTPANMLYVQLSEYLEELTKVITRKNGTVDKYIGDAIMAFWGAPDADPNQEENAAIAALLCQQRLFGLNKFWHHNGQFEFVTRIGLHSGLAVVGNVGSSDRMNYTAIGDSVNLAARLEGANKYYHTNILMSEAVKSKLSSDFISRPVDIVAVKGKETGVPIYELVGVQDHEHLHSVNLDHVAYCAQFEEMYALYLKREWDQANKRILSLQKFSNSFGLDDYLLEMYQERIAEFLKTPPAENWTGVYQQHSK